LVAASPIHGEHIVPQMISKFKEDNPAINVVVKIMEPPDVFKAVSENPEMVGFCGTRHKSSDLKYVHLGEDEIVLIVYPGHPFTLKKQIKVDDLIGECIIIRKETGGGEVIYSSLLKRAGFDLDNYQPQIVMGTSSGIISAVQAKAGIGFISNLAIKNAEAMGLIKTVRIKDIQLRKKYYLFHNKNLIPDSLVANFVSFITQYVSE
jgi:DNA-binding transcriptional LysR family regulator